jgi:general secretion pathway protein I
MNHISDFGLRISDLRPGTSFPLSYNPQSAIRNPQSKGFTLLEVMIAVAIMAMVIVSLLGLQNRSVADVMKAERITTATLLAKRMMTEALIKRPLVPAEEEGDFSVDLYGDVYKDYRWKKTIAPTPIPQVMEVRTAVLWKEGEGSEMVELVSYE